ncbi:hypothetical protein BGX24_010494 [Mortierella sp. AD032]|nr:hypothetical protein BGX24_010494 [Mortierella sp. AD032]
MDEPMVVEVIEEELKVSNRDPANLRLQIDEINTVKGFGYSASGVAADPAFLTDCPPNKMLLANYSARPDGVWFSSEADIRRAFETSGTPSILRGILRIHLEFSSVSVKGQKPVTHVKKDHTTGVEDVMVYINLSNMDSFFNEGIAEDRDDIITLKKVDQASRAQHRKPLL